MRRFINIKSGALLSAPLLISLVGLRNPIGEHVHNQIRIGSVICPEVNCKVMRTVHAFVHHKYFGFNKGAFTGLEYHRTDGQLRRSASLQNFDIRRFLETQCARARIGDFDGKGFIGVVLYIAVINGLLIHCDGWCSAATTTLIGEEECGYYQQSTANRYK